MIDICDFAVGQSRMLYGLTIQSERPSHRLMEQWHTLGVVAVITAFNFPVAVWSWNAALAAVCGDATVWKASEKTPLTAIAVTKIAESVCRETGADPAIFTLLMGDRKTVGQKLTDDARIPLVSATGSTNMGFKVAKAVNGRLGRTILELGGNNALIVSPSADINMATQSIFFGAVGTAGQRCTSTRRVIAHESVAPKIRKKLLAAYKSLHIGNPLDRETVMGPMIDKAAVDAVQQSIQRLKDEGGDVLYGGERLEGEKFQGGCYMKPCLVTAKPDFEIVQHETFGPLLYLMTYRDFDEAMAIHNDVPQGLTSSIFTNDAREAERFMSAAGSDCGIANVNTGTSGAEIGGAFGGEKQTGGGRESGSDCWKQYMRRQTNTINFSSELPLEKLIVFVCRRMYCFQQSLPLSRPPPVCFSPPNAPPISAPLVPVFTFAIPQSLPAALMNLSASRASFVKMDEVNPCGTSLWIAIASSKSRYVIKYSSGPNVSCCTISKPDFAVARHGFM